MGAEPSDRYRMRLGEMLLAKKLISESQLQAALNEKRNHLNQTGEQLQLGQIIVDMELMTEADLVRAINDHYGLSITALSDDIEAAIATGRQSRSARDLKPRIPIWFKLSIATTLIIVFAVAVLSYVVLSRQRDRLYQQTVKIGMVSLNYFDNNARIPLIEDNLLGLNTLIREAASVEGLLYAIIVDQKDVVKAHSDHSLIGSPMPEFKNTSNLIEGDDNVTYFEYRTPSGNHVLNLTRPIMFKDKILGAVHVGVSIDHIQQVIRKERRSIIWITLACLALGIGIAGILGYNFSRPISELVKATGEIGKGNYHYRTQMPRKDELGILASAFNRMGEDLWMKTLMEKSFGKYVGAEVLEMIMANPESAWLKGRKGDATVLFTDIRGFTAYSENKEPEIVVEQLNEYFEITTQAILDHNGYVDKFIGDAVLGVFGVPVFSENHAEQAVRAAVSMQKALKAAGKAGNPLLTLVGIGINSGVVVSGNIGSTGKMEYTVIGDNVNVGSRLNGLAAAGETIISKKTLELVGDLVTVEPLPPQRVKGKSEPVESFKVLSIKGERP
jgi:adenylate cyclase